MLELHGVEAGEFNRQRSSAGDARGGVVVGDVDLLHIAAGDHVALRGAPVPGDEDTAGILQSNDGGAVRQGGRRLPATPLASSAYLTFGSSSGACLRRNSEKEDRSTE